MKKNYMKPAMAVELFSLSQTIATGCGAVGNGWGDTTFGDGSTCTWVDTDGTIYWVDYSDCKEKMDSEDSLGYVCYNAPSAGNSIFTS